MRLIGIQIIDGDSEIIKNLERKWYPFCNTSTLSEPPMKPTIEFDIKDNFYDLKNNDNSHITISCIVGKNGSGKSTLLDIIYRTINNFSWHVKQSNPGIPCDLIYAYGFHSKLYFEINNKIGCIEIKANNPNDNKHINDFIQWNLNSKPLCLVNYKFDISKLSDFFYTIVTNYSIYAFNPDDYIYNPKKNYDEDSFYVNGIFQKNDAYITPIVLLPFRNKNGIIETENERKLAIQRIIALSIYLIKKETNSLIEGKSPSAITYEINGDYVINKRKKLSPEELEIIEKLCSVWNEYLQLSSVRTNNENIFNIAIFYLGYKTYKMIKQYGFFNENYSNEESAKQYTIDSFDADCITKILNDEGFMTLKIRQTIFFLKEPFSILENYKLPINDKRFNLSKDSSVDDYFIRLPPPFYFFDLEFAEDKKIKENLSLSKINSEEENNFSLSKMSSGEKQILFNISYIIYHLKNLDSKRELITGTNINATAPYKNALIIFDEAEIYLHPELQRKFIFILLSAIKSCNFHQIKNIHIIFATHSPYLLSDVVSENILLMNNDSDNLIHKQSFCSNIYDLLNNQFFIEAPIGEFSNQKINQISNILLQNKELKKSEIEYINDFKNKLGDNYTIKLVDYMLRKHKREENNV